ncbi:MAG: CoA-binding protein [Bacteroidales bacterium]|nr:CoA-binding protein [Bacteroidales bacterium]
MKANRAQIDRFLANKTMAIVGASRNEKKFGTQLFIHLQKLGFELFPVHHEAAEIQGVPCVKSIGELPATVKSICLVTHKQATDAFIGEALDHGINQIWVQQFSETEMTKSIIKNTPQANIITGWCLFMYTNPAGIHNFHRKLNKLFGSLAR